MRRSIFFFRLSARPVQDDDGVEGDRDGGVNNEANDINEKRVRSPRDWSAIFLTALRFLQFAYFAFAYFTLHNFQRSSYFREDGPWQHSADGMRHSKRMMRWVRMQASLALIYHTAVLVVPWMLRLLKTTRRPFAGLVAVFGDGCAMMALLNTLAMLDTAHEGYCHSPPPLGDFDLRDAFKLGRGRGSHHHNMSSHRSVCHSLDVTFGLGGLIILSHLVTAIVTAWRAKRSSSPTVFAKVEPASDVEQGIAHRPVRQEASVPATPQRQHSPPPPYHPVVSELAQGHYSEEFATAPRGRSSVETTTSLGAEYLVSDGWRAPEQPPEYSSRPPSLRHARA
ncbi:hypothetical protein C8A00DRAFT_28649 [Chaetomidium leptoderma]|uniref:Uncharacterized protein n=1 Tax=Chaetomidium leptoderma TaxID=669021 RepID=A0AAN6VVD1_9PEZI|nr:hypothetical protein C8A00DRAFT_28649 [Chaetomidium leptoderma]